jgi:hypothetical protein
MSTRSVIATGTEQKWRGHFCHWDGYPSAKGPDLWAIVKRDGLDAARARFLEEYATWSTISATQPNIEGVTPDKGAPFGSPEQVASYFAPGGIYGESLINVPGYGTAHRPDPEQSEWIITNDGPDGGTEWAYVLSDTALVIFERRYGDPETDDGHGTGMFGFGASDTDAGGYWKLVGTYPWDNAEPQWDDVENSTRDAATP